MPTNTPRADRTMKPRTGQPSLNRYESRRTLAEHPLSLLFDVRPELVGGKAI